MFLHRVGVYGSGALQAGLEASFRGVGYRDIRGKQSNAGSSKRECELGEGAVRADFQRDMLVDTGGANNGYSPYRVGKVWGAVPRNDACPIAYGKGCFEGAIVMVQRAAIVVQSAVKDDGNVYELLSDVAEDGCACETACMEAPSVV